MLFLSRIFPLHSIVFWRFFLSHLVISWSFPQLLYFSSLSSFFPSIILFISVISACIFFIYTHTFLCLSGYLNPWTLKHTHYGVTKVIFRGLGVSWYFPFYLLLLLKLGGPLCIFHIVFQYYDCAKGLCSYTLPERLWRIRLLVALFVLFPPSPNNRNYSWAVLNCWVDLSCSCICGHTLKDTWPRNVNMAEVRWGGCWDLEER